MKATVDRWQGRVANGSAEVHSVARSLGLGLLCCGGQWIAVFLFRERIATERGRGKKRSGEASWACGSVCLFVYLYIY